MLSFHHAYVLPNDASQTTARHSSRWRFLDNVRYANSITHPHNNQQNMDINRVVTDTQVERIKLKYSFSSQVTNLAHKLTPHPITNNVINYLKPSKYQFDTAKSSIHVEINTV